MDTQRVKLLYRVVFSIALVLVPLSLFLIRHFFDMGLMYLFTLIIMPLGVLGGVFGGGVATFADFILSGRGVYRLQGIVEYKRQPVHLKHNVLLGAVSGATFSPLFLFLCLGLLGLLLTYIPPLVILLIFAPMGWWIPTIALPAVAVVVLIVFLDQIIAFDHHDQ